MSRHHHTEPAGRRRHRRFFRSGELPLVILALLARRPQHGYDLMAELDRLFGPEYRPSPGSIYPALSALEAEGLVEVAAASDRKTYAITSVGHDALQARAELLAEIESRTGARLTSSETLQPALDRFVARLRGLAGDMDIEVLERLLDETAKGAEDLARREGTR
jgi:DNA-binding PadR family transcriptional regulator